MSITAYFLAPWTHRTPRNFSTKQLDSLSYELELVSFYRCHQHQRRWGSLWQLRTPLFCFSALDQTADCKDYPKYVSCWQTWEWPPSNWGARIQFLRPLFHFLFSPLSLSGRASEVGQEQAAPSLCWWWQLRARHKSGLFGGCRGTEVKCRSWLPSVQHDHLYC